MNYIAKNLWLCCGCHTAFTAFLRLRLHLRNSKTIMVCDYCTDSTHNGFDYTCMGVRDTLQNNDYHLQRGSSFMRSNPASSKGREGRLEIPCIDLLFQRGQHLIQTWENTKHRSADDSLMSGFEWNPPVLISEGDTFSNSLRFSMLPFGASRCHFVTSTNGLFTSRYLHIATLGPGVEEQCYRSIFRAKGSVALILASVSALTPLASSLALPYSIVS